MSDKGMWRVQMDSVHVQVIVEKRAAEVCWCVGRWNASKSKSTGRFKSMQS